MAENPESTHPEMDNQITETAHAETPLNKDEYESELPEKRTRTLTEKGLDYMKSLKEKAYNKAYRELKDKIIGLDMTWTDIKVPDVLRKERLELEECRRNLEKDMCEYAAFMTEEHAERIFEIAVNALRQAEELRKRVGEMIFEIEKEEIRSRISERSYRSRKTKQ